MKKKVVSVILAMTMVASMAMGCGSSSDTTTSDNSTTTTTTNDAAASTEASDAADATADAANGDLADKKVGVCIYQFADNFMTLFRGELENYLVEQGFSKDNITIVDGANDQATQTNPVSYTHLSTKHANFFIRCRLAHYLRSTLTARNDCCADKQRIRNSL